MTLLLPLSLQPAEGEGDKKDAKKGKGATAGNSDVFILHPAEMDIPVDETQELFIYAFPKVSPPPSQSKGGNVDNGGQVSLGCV